MISQVYGDGGAGEGGISPELSGCAAQAEQEKSGLEMRKLCKDYRRKSGFGMKSVRAMGVRGS